MLAIAAGIAAGMFVLTTTAVGGRLAWVSRKSPGSPEFLMGAGMLAIGILGYPLGLVSGFGQAPVGEVRTGVWLVSYVAIDLGLLCMYVFTWRVFRPGVGWAASLVAAAVLVLVGITGVQLHALLTVSPDLASNAIALRWGMPFLLGSGGCFLWTGIEGALQHRMARRRLALGLADPVVVNRFLLWAVFGASAFLINAASGVALAMGVHGNNSPGVQLATGLFGVVGAMSMYLACVPPSWYLARVRGEAPA